MLHVFQLTTTLAFGDIDRITRALCALPGVHGIEAEPGSRALQVHFDETRISPQGLARAAARAGYAEAGRAPASGGCCGACGG